MEVQGLSLPAAPFSARFQAQLWCCQKRESLTIGVHLLLGGEGMEAQPLGSISRWRFKSATSLGSAPGLTTCGGAWRAGVGRENRTALSPSWPQLIPQVAQELDGPPELSAVGMTGLGFYTSTLITPWVQDPEKET